MGSDLDGAHAGNATDDGFVAQYDADGSRRWLTQFKVPGVADRSYSVTVSGTDVYVGGYTKGALDGANRATRMCSSLGSTVTGD